MTQQAFFLNLAKEIISQCSSDTATSLDLCIYLMDLKLLQLSKNLSLLAQDAHLKETLVKKCVNDLKEDSLSVKILQLQLFWRKKYQPRDDIKKIHHERVFKNVLPIMSEITDYNPVKTADKEHHYKKIVIFIIMFAGLGSPTQPSIIKETQAALHSIFKTTELENFVSLPRAVKEQQLVEFSRLITGILLFNKDCKKGGEKMDDLPLILTQGVRATKERFFNFKDQLDQKIDRIVKTLLRGFGEGDSQRLKDKNSHTVHENEILAAQDFQKEKVDDFKTLLIYFRHVEYYLNELIKDLDKSFVVVEDLVKRLQATLLQLHNVVRYRVAVATVQVFPLFIQLSNIWVEMQEEVDILSEINNNFVDLSLAGKLELTFSTPLQLPSSNETTLPSETAQIVDSLDFYPGVKVCSISSVSSQECLQYKGFCAWTLACAEGLLIPGNITIGLMHFSNRFYTFSSTEAAYKWALNPVHNIKTVLRVARTKSELIKFLNLEDDLLEKLAAEEEKRLTLANAQVQTELHPLEHHINKEYTFSEWEIKRRAMKLAALTRCVTKSQQTTEQSRFRTEMGVQVTPWKSKGTQTARDGFSHYRAAPKSAWSFRTGCI